MPAGARWQTHLLPGGQMDSANRIHQEHRFCRMRHVSVNRMPSIQKGVLNAPVLGILGCPPSDSGLAIASSLPVATRIYLHLHLRIFAFQRPGCRPRQRRSRGAKHRHHHHGRRFSVASITGGPHQSHHIYYQGWHWQRQTPRFAAPTPSLSG